ncbi:hypothetical protein O53_1255 [Microcystis aeruginosa TAIHU98]|uniref:Uncharacterized protein n=1 Tax=Microcystis aeruginosa TAIHU98 TaxID=1134457 RepID=L7ECS9_MICAE|nr:hypothetical protein O53_1255 [Microcystis aeruginosa TAIHU98]
MKQLPHFPTSPLPHFPTSPLPHFPTSPLPHTPHPTPHTPHPTPHTSLSLNYQNYESKNCLFRIRSNGSADDS